MNELPAPFAEKMKLAVGVIDVKNYYIETVKGVAFRQKLRNMVHGTKKVREEL